MKSCFRKLPNVLRRRVLGSVAGGAIFLCVFIVSWIGTGRLTVSIPLLAMALFFLGGCGWLVYQSSHGKILTVTGICTGVEYSKIFRKSRSISVTAQDKLLKIPLRKSIPVRIGDRITIYLSEKTPVYPYRDCYTVGSYIAIAAERNPS